MIAAPKNKLLDSSTGLQAKSQTELIVGSEVHLRLLKLVEQNPAWTQRQLADALGISLGKTNYCLRALRDKGLIKWGNFSQNPNKLQYMHLPTPLGIAQKARLTAHFLHRKGREFEELQGEIQCLRAELVEGNPGPRAETTAVSLGESSPLAKTV